MTPREELYQMIADLETAKKALRWEEWQKGYEDACTQLYFSVHPKRRKAPTVGKIFAEFPEQCQAIQDKYNKMIRQAMATHADLKTRTEKKLAELSESLELRPSDTPCLYETIWESTYSNQTQSRLYAQRMAELHLLHAQHHGIKGEIRETVRKWKGGADAWGRPNQTSDFEVFLFLAKEDLMILRNKPQPPLREIVRQCWKKGVNPRVYFPFLPYGYEQSENLDYHGNCLSNLTRNP